jgi:hypothetical protein
MTKSKVFVWPGCVVEEAERAEFKDFFMREFGMDGEFLEQVETNPNQDENSNEIEDTGGRKDAFFRVTATEEQLSDPRWVMARMMMSIADWDSARPHIAAEKMEYIYPAHVFEAYPVNEVVEE